MQGVGFRPFVYRLANELGLAGWVSNDPRGVRAELEGPARDLLDFRSRLEEERPPLARIHEISVVWLAPRGEDGFEIRESATGGDRSTAILPDAATCDACLAEVFDPTSRRYRYPFTNCTNCGPRVTIVKALPYDRPNTTMAGFAMCADCRAEYHDPLDRRFHAQPIACPACGPRLALWSATGAVLATGDAALLTAADALRAGRIVALKGLGGFQLLCDARDETAVQRLRHGKRREEKPFALLVRDLAAAEELAELSRAETAVLASVEAPIVLVPRRLGAWLAPGVAPGRPDLGVMLPATPLHHLLARDTGFPLVATSGNLRDEPIAIDETEALARLGGEGGVADLFLVHDRPIERHVDDSVVRCVAGAPRLLRRARGYAPLPLGLANAIPTLLAVGGHQKCTVALGQGRQVFLSQHIGDLETPQALDAFERVIADFLRLYGAKPVAVAHDLHPGYASTLWAERSGLPLVGVQHHHAHLAACLADSGAEGPALGVTWDGTGYGPDGTIWGGEFLAGDALSYRRIATLRPFRLPGGDAAAREPRRAALGLLHDLFGAAAFSRDDLPSLQAFEPAERHVLSAMLERGVNAPVTSSAGRLFDAVASLLGVRQRNGHEGQAAMELEALASPDEEGAYPLPFDLTALVPVQLDWRPLVEALLSDRRRGVDGSLVSARFHNALVSGIVRVAILAAEPRVALTGGCFQNTLLLTKAARRLAEAGFEVLLHRQVPPNDGGLALGQVAVAAARLAQKNAAEAAASERGEPCVSASPAR